MILIDEDPGEERLQEEPPCLVVCFEVALEVVQIAALVDDGLVVGGETVLHLLPCPRVHQRFVRSWINRAAVVHFAFVVGVPQDLVQRGDRQFLAGPPGRSPRGEAAVGELLEQDRQRAVAPDHFRKRIVPRICRHLAWQLHIDSQNYTPRERDAPPLVAPSGDTPYLAQGDIASKDAAEHQEELSRLWASVYTLRADILRAERLKTWPHDATEPETSRTALADAVAERDRSVRRVRVLVQRYLDRYGDPGSIGECPYPRY